MVFFNFPEKSLVNRNIPKIKFYEHANINKSTKEAFVSQVQQVVWAFKLATETINLSALNGLYEIQVFDIFLKTKELNEQVLLSIDKAIPHPILFQLHYSGQIKLVLSYKRQSEIDKNKWIIERYYSTNWVEEAEVRREQLPVAFDMNSLYENILKKFISPEDLTSESVQSLNNKVVEIEKKKEEVLRLEKKLKNEKQFNRKVEINIKLNEVRKYLLGLTK